jgi:predicted short-subunit dehydrogenase-like oxidoreductase (DUF2520 family)
LLLCDDAALPPVHCIRSFQLLTQSRATEVFRDVYFCVEGDARAVRIARMLVAQLGGRSFTVTSESKPLYHASAVRASGHVVALFDLAVTDAARVRSIYLRSSTRVATFVEQHSGKPSKQDSVKSVDRSLHARRSHNRSKNI